MPAEWESHVSTWLAWPQQVADWPGKFELIPWVYSEIVRAITRHETVDLIIPPGEESEAVISSILRQAGADLGRVVFHPLPTNRSWVRDSGPIFVANDRGERIVLDWHFNGWAKYDNWALDDSIPAFVAGLRGLPSVQPRQGDWRMVLEGGSIDVNGQGLLLTTEECLLSTMQQRNPPLDRAGYEQAFAAYLGVKKTIWLDRGIVGDDTHGHVDDLARFVNDHTIVAAVEPRESDENHTILEENFERLRSATDLEGRKLEVVALPMPRPVVFDGVRLPASYANFYIAGGLVIVPTFNDPADRLALGILQDLFPDREVVGIHCIDLVWGLGTLHCMTQQEPGTPAARTRV
jgi:agmatine deiminase